jgi:predicted restriction endonuclease
MVKCEICGFEMKTRLNGSHLKRNHNIEEHKI